MNLLLVMLKTFSYKEESFQSSFDSLGSQSKPKF